MVCHGEAARTRPAAESLTDFYFCIATGGAVGGLVVSLVAPWIFPNYWEYPLGVLGCIVVVLSVSSRERSSWWYTGKPSLALMILAGCAWLAPRVLAPLWKEASRLPPSFGTWASCGPGRSGRCHIRVRAPRAKTVARTISGSRRGRGSPWRLLAAGPGNSAGGGTLPRHRVIQKFLRRLVRHWCRRGEQHRAAIRQHRSRIPVPGSRNARGWQPATTVQTAEQTS